MFPASAYTQTRERRLTTSIDRTKRVKEARDEAKKEIDAYRKQKDEEFKKFEAEACQTIIYYYKFIAD